MHSRILFALYYIATSFCFSYAQTSIAQNDIDGIKNIIIYATNPAIMTPFDDTRLSFFESWAFGGMHFKCISEPDSIKKFVKMITNLQPLDTLSYNTYSNGTVQKKTRNGKIIFLPPSRPGPIGAIIIFFEKTPNELLWATPISIDYGFVAYKIPLQLKKMIYDIGHTPNKHYYLFKNIYQPPEL